MDLVVKINKILHQLSPPRPEGQQRIVMGSSEGVQEEILSQKDRTLQIWSVALASGQFSYPQVPLGDELPDRDEHQYCLLPFLQSRAGPMRLLHVPHAEGEPQGPPF